MARRPKGYATVNRLGAPSRHERAFVAHDCDAPPLEELLRERWRSLRQLLDAADLEALIVHGHGALHRYGYLEYCAGFCPWQQDGVLLLGRKGPLVLVIEDNADAPDLNCPVILRAPQRELRETVERCVEVLALNESPLGVAGPDAWFFRWLFPDRAFRDVTHLLQKIKSLKCAGDVAHLKHGADLADRGMDTFAECVRPGKDMRSTCSEVERKLKAGGARETIVRLGRGPRFSEPSSPDTVSANELLCAYVEVLGANGYWVELMRPVIIGEIDDAARRLLDACIEAAEIAEELLRPGTSVAKLFETVHATASRRGFRLDGKCGHGVGIDDQDFPKLIAGDPTILEAGMTVALHPRLIDERRTTGAVVGDTFLITSDGPHRFSRYSNKAIQVES